jgi:hypothetical protein
MRRSKEFFLQESDDSYMNRSPIGGLVPYGGFLKNFVYLDFSNIAINDSDLLHIARNQDVQNRSQLNGNFRI